MTPTEKFQALWDEPQFESRLNPAAQSTFTVFIEDRDGGEIDFEEFDSVDELLKEWPYAVKESYTVYRAFIGGRR